MTALIGRERELAAALAVISGAQSSPVAQTLVIDGTSGVGKTALLDAVLEGASGWITSATVAHRIQASLPQAVIKRILSGLTLALGERAERYCAGLGDLASSGDQRQALLRLLEGVTLDHPVLLSIDDAQWLDEDSADSLASIFSTLADRPLVLAMTQRVESGEAGLRVPADVVIPLTALSDTAASSVARAHYPTGSDAVIAAIVRQAGGHPIDLVALAQSASDRTATTVDDVDASVRAVAVQTIATLPAPLREFLQVISLLNEPIDYALLLRMWPNERQLVDLIAAASERFLVQEGTQLRFAHAQLGAAVLETIPVKIPLRKRILDALSASTTLSVEDYLQIAEQANACGDRELARSTLTTLAFSAIERAQVRLTISVCEQLLALGEPTDATFVGLYSGYARALQFTDRVDRAIDVLQHALDEAARRNITAVAPLAAQLVLALWFHDHRDRAIQKYEGFKKRFTDPGDRLHLQAAALWFAVCNADTVQLEQTLAELKTLAPTAPPELTLRSEIARAYHSVRIGEFDNARAAIERVEEIARRVPDAMRHLADFASAFVELNLVGANQTKMEQLRRSHRDVEGGSWTDFLYASSELLAGRYNNAMLTLENMNAYSDPLHRRRMLAIAVALNVLTDGNNAYDKMIASDISRLLTGDRGHWLMPLASWATLIPENDQRARVLSRIVLDHLNAPGDPLLMLQATPVAVSAKLRRDTELLSHIASGTGFWNSQSPIEHADRMLAQAIASGVGIQKAVDECGRLGLVSLQHLAALATAKSSAPLAEEKSPLTARERQIADLISDGKTNREIAETLVLSERTVEGHVANIFNKLSVSSRTAIAAWILRTKTAS